MKFNSRGNFMSSIIPQKIYIQSGHQNTVLGTFPEYQIMRVLRYFTAITGDQYLISLITLNFLKFIQ